MIVAPKPPTYDPAQPTYWRWLGAHHAVDDVRMDLDPADVDDVAGQVAANIATIRRLDRSITNWMMGEYLHAYLQAVKAQVGGE